MRRERDSHYKSNAATWAAGRKRWAAAAAGLLAACVAAGPVAYGQNADRDDDEPAEAEVERGLRPSRPGPTSRSGGPHRGPGRPERPPGPPRDGFGRPGGRPDAEFFLSAEEREEVLAFAREHFPEVYERLQEDEERAREMHGPGHRSAWRMQRFLWPMIRLMRIAKYDPELADLLIAEQKVEMELAELQRDYLAFPADSVRGEIKKQMRALFAERFDLRRRRLEREIRSLQERLEEARQRLEQQDAAKGALIDAELSELIRELEERPVRPGVEPPLFEQDDDNPPAPPPPPAEPPLP